MRCPSRQHGPGPSPGRQRRRSGLAAALLAAPLVAGPAFAATPVPPSQPQERSEGATNAPLLTPDMRPDLDAPAVMALPAMPGNKVPRLKLAVEEPPQVATGPVPPDPERDYAYGAFQRGYYLTAVAVATRRAQDDDSAAQTLLGVLYERGYGVTQNVKVSASWYEIAAKAGNPQAAYRLGLYYLLGTGVKADKTRAGDLFEQAANAGIDSAAYNLGVLYLQGEGRPQDRNKGIELFKRAADNGDVEAQYALADAYLDQDSPDRDPRHGAFWMGRAARNGSVPAQVRYGILRFQGEGVEPNEEEAAIWFERAAQSGNPVAMNRLARLYATGRGVEIDPLKAATWHLVARKAGLSDLWLDGFLGSLDADTLAKAREEASNWTQGQVPGAATAPRVPRNGGAPGSLGGTGAAPATPLMQAP